MLNLTKSNSAFGILSLSKQPSIGKDNQIAPLKEKNNNILVYYE
jgi:hypothetical protein